MPTRKARGSRTQALVAEAYRGIWPHATSAGAGAAGRDVLNVPLSIEVKGRRAFTPLEWVKQARRSARPEQDEFPAHVVMRPDGVGEANIGDFLVIRRLCDDIDLMAELARLRQRVAGLEAVAPDRYRTKTGKVLTDADIEALAAEDQRLAAIDAITPEDMRRRRRELLEYTDRNGLMSPAACAELEELRGAES